MTEKKLKPTSSDGAPENTPKKTSAKKVVAGKITATKKSATTSKKTTPATSGSNTGKNNQKKPEDKPKGRGKGKPFVKGDPRINRNGRPRTFDALRKKVLDVLYEELKSGDGKITTTYLDLIIRNWVTSGNFQKQQGALQIGFGKVPDTINLQFDLKALNNNQLKRISEGEDIISVLTHPNG